MARKTQPNSGLPRLPEADAPHPGEGVQPPEVEHSRLLISRRLLDLTLSKLAARSAETRESAAIWAGTIAGEDSLATEVHFHHELCDDRGSELSLELTEEAKFRLYETLHGSGLKLVALIHTHPESWVGLSHIDQRNQVCSRIGFWSLVVPNYGRRPWDLFALGVHIRADNGWYQVPKAKIADRIIISG